MDAQTLAAAMALSKGSGGGGSGGGYLKVGIDETGTLDKTWKEISDALNAGYYVSIATPYESGGGLQMIFTETNVEQDSYSAKAGFGTDIVWFFADSENGYPVAEQ